MSAWNFIKNELLGVDDWASAAKHIRKGEFLDAAKSVGEGALELGGTAAAVGGVVAAPFTGGASLAVTGGAAARATASAAGKQGVKAVVKKEGKQALKTVEKNGLKGPQFKKPEGGDWNPYRPVKPNQGPLKPLPGGGGSASRGGTTVVEAPSSTRPDFNPLRDTKPFDPFDNPKSNPWPGMPKVEPKPAAPKPAPAPAPAPKPATTKPKTTTPWKPSGSVKPDAATKPNTKPTVTTETAPQTAAMPVTGFGKIAAVGTGIAGLAALSTFMPKPKTGDPDKWNPSSIV